jgi:hypothetical protein
MLPYTKIDNYILDDDKIEEYYEHFKKYADNILYRDNAGTAPKVTTIYGHDDFIKDNLELVEYKNKTLNAIAEKFISDFDLDVTYNCFILITKADKILQWHVDGAGSAGAPQAAFMYDFRNTERAPTIFDYNGEIYTLDGYKAALINTSTMHMVDNTGHRERYNLRISFYGRSFEEIRDKINEKNI